MGATGLTATVGDGAAAAVTVVDTAAVVGTVVACVTTVVVSVTSCAVASGEPFEEKSLHPVGVVATNAMGSLANPEGAFAKASVHLFWNTPVRTGSRRYYDNCLYLFALLALSGRFRIWLG